MDTILAAATPADPAAAASGFRPDDFLQSVANIAEDLSCLRRGSVRTGALMGTGQAAQLAAEVEAISRTVEYLQLVCAGALERHRVAEAFGLSPASVPGHGAAAGAAETGTPEWNNTWAAADSAVQRAAGKAHAEFRTTADYLRCRLRISRGEAQRRLKLASALLPGVGASGQPVPPALPALADRAAAGEISSAAAASIADAMEQVMHRSDTATAAAMEADLATIASRHDQDFLARTARRWVLLANQDGAEPTEEELRRFQGVFTGHKKNGLNHLNIYCTADQQETLLTVMNAAAGPRVTETPPVAPFGNEESAEARSGAVFAQCADGSFPDAGTVSRLDRRTRPQRLLNGLVDAAKAALAAGGVPAAGGLRPQVMVTIKAASLLRKFNYGSVLKDMDSMEEPARQQKIVPGTATPGSFAFTGPVPAATVRKLACDADVLPVVLSGAGRILDIGRAQRLFPPHLRKALHARDGGCAFPGCTIPGPWTEAHHIQYWSRGGSTSTDNGVLLCSHHHHEVHKQNWQIIVRAGVPWFIPPAYVDPERVALRNMYFCSSFEGQAAV